MLKLSNRKKQRRTHVGPLSLR
uniref:Uncharacterized protein n=1 Tax=Anguilla anguilla TaxID=7936 RepID=A0A0E9TPK9_ANGAN